MTGQQSHDHSQSEDMRQGAASGFVPVTARLHTAPSTARLGAARGLLAHDRSLADDRREGESTFDRLVDDLTENAGASDDFSVRSVFRAISDDVASNKEDIGLSAARTAAADALDKLKATLPGHGDAKAKHPRKGAHDGGPAHRRR